MLDNAKETVVTLPVSVRVLMPNGQIEEMKLESYLAGVVAAEIGTTAPLEALKAQAVASRTYVASSQRHLEHGADVCTTAHCQKWKRVDPVSAPEVYRALSETWGMVALCDGKLIDAFFFEHCDGRTRNSEEMMMPAVKYLRGVDCSCGFLAMKGHGVGMCKRGAIVMARHSASFEQILRHYYRGVVIIRTDRENHVAEAPAAEPEPKQGPKPESQPQPAVTTAESRPRGRKAKEPSSVKRTAPARVQKDKAAPIEAEPAAPARASAPTAPPVAPRPAAASPTPARAEPPAAKKEAGTIPSTPRKRPAKRSQTPSVRTTQESEADEPKPNVPTRPLPAEPEAATFTETAPQPPARPPRRPSVKPTPRLAAKPAQQPAAKAVPATAEENIPLMAEKSTPLTTKEPVLPATDETLLSTAEQPAPSKTEEPAPLAAEKSTPLTAEEIAQVFAAKTTPVASSKPAPQASTPTEAAPVSSPPTPSVKPVEPAQQPPAETAPLTAEELARVFGAKTTPVTPKPTPQAPKPAEAASRTEDSAPLSADNTQLTADDTPLTAEELAHVFGAKATPPTPSAPANGDGLHKTAAEPPSQPAAKPHVETETAPVTRHVLIGEIVTGGDIAADEKRRQAKPRRVHIDHLPGPRMIAGCLPTSGVTVTIEDDRGHKTILFSGAAPHYGEGGFETVVDEDGRYLVSISDQVIEVQVQGETVFIHASG